MNNGYSWFLGDYAMNKAIQGVWLKGFELIQLRKLKRGIAEQNC